MSRQIALSQGCFAVVDDSDYEAVNAYTWHAVVLDNLEYAYSSRDGEGAISLHRFLMNPPDDVVVDHKNCDGLDNTRSNLRVCRNQKNLWNRRKHCETSSRFKGVYRAKNGWRAAIEQNKTQLKLGTYRSEFQAARQYDRAARIFFGSFARTNEMLGLFNGALDRIIEIEPPKAKTVKLRKPKAQIIFNSEMARLGIVPKIAHSRLAR